MICGQLNFILNQKKKNGDSSLTYQTLGGTSAKRLKELKKSREDGKSVSRVASIIVGQKLDFLFVADSGSGEENEKGLIVPKFGNEPENHVAVSMMFDALSELILVTQAHYQAWLCSLYVSRTKEDDKS